MATLLYNHPAALRSSRAFNTMLREVLRDTQTAAPKPAASFVPAADIVETAAGFELHLALPGVKKEAVSIEFLDGQLVIAGERPSPAAADEAEATRTFRRLETGHGTFRRSFRLPDTVNVKAIAAELTDGMLHVALPFDTDKVTKQQIAVR